MEKLRIDKWLWAARFYKTRSLAVEELNRGRVQVNGQEAKPSREVRPGDNVVLQQGPVRRTVVVLDISGQRGPAPVAQQLYEETAASIDERVRAAEQRRLAPEPALTIAHGRPTKRDRRDLGNKTWGRPLERVDRRLTACALPAGRAKTVLLRPASANTGYLQLPSGTRPHPRHPAIAAPHRGATGSSGMPGSRRWPG
jgi:ribosome-associated heat shock protein Hsp15